MEAMAELGRCFYEGIGTDVNHKKSFHFYSKAAELGNIRAMENLAYFLFEGIGAEKDAAKSFYWHERIVQSRFQNHFSKSENSYQDSESNMSEEMIIEHGIEIDKERYDDYKFEEFDDTTSFTLDEKLPLSNYDSKSSNNTLDYFEQLSKFLSESELLQICKQYAEYGSCVAMNKLGKMYQNGEGAQADTELAVSWFSKAAELENVAAMFSLAECFQHGAGVRQDHDEAISWYRRAAEAGDSDSMVAIGHAYSTGIGAKKCRIKSIEWWSKAAEAGNLKAKELIVPYPDQIGEIKDHLRLSSVADYLHTDSWPLEPIIAGKWYSLRGEKARPVLFALSCFSILTPDRVLHPCALRETAVSFYPAVRLIEALIWINDEERVVSFLYNEENIILINGKNHLINHLNLDGFLDISNSKKAIDYLKFFCMVVVGTDGSFRIIDSIDGKSFVDIIDSKVIKSLSSDIIQVTLVEKTMQALIFTGTVQYGNAIFYAKFELSHNKHLGAVKMLHDVPLASNLPLYRDGFDGVFRTRQPLVGDA